MREHLLEVVEILVGFPKLGQGLKGSCVDRSNFLVCSLFVLHIHLVPLFQQLDSLFAPGDISFGCQLINRRVLELGTPQEANSLLAVEVVNVRSIRDLVLNAINDKNACV